MKTVIANLVLLALLMCATPSGAQVPNDTLWLFRSCKNPTWTFVFVSVVPDHSEPRTLVLEYEGLDWDEFGWFIAWYRSPTQPVLDPVDSQRQQPFTFATPQMCVGTARVFLVEPGVVPEEITTAVGQPFLPAAL